MSTAVTTMPRIWPQVSATERRTSPTVSGKGRFISAVRVMLTRTPVKRSDQARRQLTVVTPGTSSAARRSTADAARSAIRRARVGPPKGSVDPGHT